MPTNSNEFGFVMSGSANMEVDKAIRSTYLELRRAATVLEGRRKRARVWREDLQSFINSLWRPDYRASLLCWGLESKLRIFW